MWESGRRSGASRGSCSFRPDLAGRHHAGAGSSGSPTAMTPRASSLWLYRHAAMAFSPAPSRMASVTHQRRPVLRLKLVQPRAVEDTG
jgi:hypothetical protein